MLEKNPDLRLRMSKAASADIRARFSLEATVENLQAQYEKIRKQPPGNFDFKKIFGESPFDWFMSGLGDYAPLFSPGAEDSARKERRLLPFLYENSKSSLAHFLRYFPEDAKLRYWLGVLENDLTQHRKNA